MLIERAAGFGFWALLCCLCASRPLASAAAPAEKGLAEEILAATGFRGGLIVHLACGDGALAAALSKPENCLVHGLDTDPQAVSQARQSLQKLGLYGKASVQAFDGKLLPYADNIVNLLVAEDLGGVAEGEAMRVLAPGGTLFTKRGGRWERFSKPIPTGTDDWTHFLHDSSGNAVSRDQAVGPPRGVQWLADPPHARSHEHTPSTNALVSAAGRIFYFADLAPAASIRASPRWHLVARDAYNGLLLWQRPIGPWFPHIVNWGATPPQLQRRLVASPSRIYATLGLHAPLSALDPATGETLETYDGTEGAEEVILHGGTLILAVRAVTPQRRAELDKWARLVAQDNSPVFVRESAEPLVKALRSTDAAAEVAVMALDAASGRRLWSEPGPGGLKPNSLCAIADRVFYQMGKEVICRELESGRELWTSPAPPMRVASSAAIVCADAQALTALSPQTGKALWSQPASLHELRDAFVIRGALWLGGFRPLEGALKAKRGPSWGPYCVAQHDLATGKLLKEIVPENPGHHHRCWTNKATERYILAGRRGVEFIDLATGDVLWHSWVRGVCRYGVMPANGLLYTPPHACGCYIAAKLSGFYALTPTPQAEAPQGPALERGPAFSAPPPPTPSTQHPPPSAWPTYRHDAARSGATPAQVPAALRIKWRATLGGTLTSPTIAEGKVFVASVDQHRVCALDAESGQTAWHFTADARVDSPPTIHAGRALFGGRDGAVYCLRAADGALAWRLQPTAHARRRIVARGQLEAIAPLHGSVLVRDGVAFAAAGRSSYLDGGIALHRIKPETGEVLSTTPLYSPDPVTGRQPKQQGPCNMPGALTDILSADGQYIYLRDLTFDPQGAPQPKGNPHLLTLTGFLDDAWPHRSYWVFGTQCSIATGCSGRDRDLVYGRLLAFDSETVYGYGRKGVHWSNHLQDGPYRLFALGRGDGKERWARAVPIAVRAMLLAGGTLFAAGPPTAAAAAWEPSAEGQGALLIAYSAADGAELARCPLDASPVFDGMAAAPGRLYLATTQGALLGLAQSP